jgi:hypothetical protein
MAIIWPKANIFGWFLHIYREIPGLYKEPKISFLITKTRGVRA